MVEKERRELNSGPPTMMMKSFQEMGIKGRRKMQWVGGVLMTLSAVVGLTVPLIATVPIPYYILVGVIFLVGCGFFWPQYGVLLLSAVPVAIAKIIPTKKVVDALRPERRNR